MASLEKNKKTKKQQQYDLAVAHPRSACSTNVCNRHCLQALLSNDEKQQQTLIWTSLHRWEASTLTTVPLLLPTMVNGTCWLFVLNWNTYFRICATEAGPYQSPACFPVCLPIETRRCRENGHRSSSSRSPKNLRIYREIELLLPFHGSKK